MICAATRLAIRRTILDDASVTFTSLRNSGAFQSSLDRENSDRDTRIPQTTVFENEGIYPMRLIKHNVRSFCIRIYDR